MICLVIGYVDELLTELWKIVEKPGSVKMRVTSPPPLCSAFEHAIDEQEAGFCNHNE